MNTLLAYGGGCDSTLILRRLLTQTEDNVHCFYLDLSAVQYDDPRAKGDFFLATCETEKIVIPRVMAWMTAHTGRAVSCDIIEVTEIVQDEWMTPTVIRKAAELVVDYDRFILGRSAENNSPNHGKKTTPWYKQLWKDLAPPGKPMQWPLVQRNEGRAHALAELPSDLQALLISCHDPSIVDGEPVICNVCDKCRLTADSRRLLAEGQSADEVLRYCLKRKGAGVFSNTPLRDARYQSGTAGNPLPWLKTGNGGL